MATLTIQNIDEETLRRLQERAARNGRSTEEEMHGVLHDSMRNEEPQLLQEEDLGSAIRKRFAPFGGVELEIPSRKSYCPIPTFE